MSLSYPLVSFQEKSSNSMEKLLNLVRNHIPIESEKKKLKAIDEKANKENENNMAKEQQKLSFQVSLALTSIFLVRKGLKMFWVFLKVFFHLHVLLYSLKIVLLIVQVKFESSLCYRNNKTSSFFVCVCGGAFHFFPEDAF